MTDIVISGVNNMNCDFEVITSMSLDYYHRTGNKFVESFDEYWPQNVTLQIYTENQDQEKLGEYCGPVLSNKRNGTIRAIPNTYDSFVARNIDKPHQKTNSLEHGAIRFAPKAFSIIDCLENAILQKRKFNRNFYLIWLDADSVTHTKIDNHFFKLITDNYNPDMPLSYLGRKHSYTETGFICFNISRQSDELWRFLYSYGYYYSSDAIFTLPQWHDCMPFDVARKSIDPQENKCLNLSPPNSFWYDHVFINSELGKYMDHMKGPRKDVGRSKKEESNHDHPYWKV
jgi:hypothetical protein